MCIRDSLYLNIVQTLAEITMDKLSQLEKELSDALEGVQACDDMLALSPDSEEAKEFKATLQQQVVDAEQQIAAEKAKQAASQPPPAPPSDDAELPPPPPPKYDMSKHPKFRKPSPDAPPAPPEETPHAQQTVFNVKELISAKYSEDKQWYPATIISKTGSSMDPVYTVTFKGYGNTETKRKNEIRPLHNENKKRKADGSPAVSAPQPPASPKPATNGTVISAAPSVDPTLVQKREPSKVSDGPTRMAPEPKKLKGNKALEKSKSSWNDWQKSGPKKGALAAPKKKDSQFRTPDLPNSKVGFTGSGKPMSKDQARAKWNYGAGDHED